jgi:hypothetical protein
MTKLAKDRRARAIRIAFFVCILTAMIFGLLASLGYVGKKLSEVVFGVCWLLAINLWHAIAIFEGEVHWQGGPLLVSRTKTPIRFWLFLCCTFTLFNGCGFLLLSRRR